MSLLIGLPSKARPEGIKEHTLSWLSSSKYAEQVVVFVEPQDEAAYAPLRTQWKVEVLPENDQGFGHVKGQMQEYARQHDLDFIFKLDDDLFGWNGRGPKLTPADSAKLFDQAIDDSLALMAVKPQIVGVGFPYRWEMYTKRKWTEVNTRFQTCYLVRTEHLYPHPGVSVFEDFYTYLCIRAANLLTIRYGLAGIDCVPVGEGDGGHQSFDRQQRVLQEADLLREVHPALEFRKREGKSWLLEPKLSGAFFGRKRLD